MGPVGLIVEFSALREALAAEGKQLAFAVNAGMYKEDFSPVGLFVAEGRELVPLNRHVGSGNFSQQPNGVFLIEGRSARVMTTGDYGEEKPKATLATQSGPMLVHEGEITTSAVMSPTSTWRKMRNGVCAPSLDHALHVGAVGEDLHFEVIHCGHRCSRIHAAASGSPATFTAKSVGLRSL